MKYKFQDMDIVGFYDGEMEHLASCIMEYAIGMSKMRQYKSLKWLHTKSRVMLKKEVLLSDIIQELLTFGLTNG